MALRPHSRFPDVRYVNGSCTCNKAPGPHFYCSLCARDTIIRPGVVCSQAEFEQRIRLGLKNTGVTALDVSREECTLIIPWSPAFAIPSRRPTGPKPPRERIKAVTASIDTDDGRSHEWTKNAFVLLDDEIDTLVQHTSRDLTRGDSTTSSCRRVVDMTVHFCAHETVWYTLLRTITVVVDKRSWDEIAGDIKVIAHALALQVALLDAEAHADTVYGNALHAFNAEHFVLLDDAGIVLESFPLNINSITVQHLVKCDE